MGLVDEVLDLGFQVRPGACPALLHVDGQEVGRPVGQGGLSAQLLDEVAGGIEHLHPFVAPVGNEDIAGRVDGDAGRTMELAVAVAAGAVGCQVFAVGGELLDPVVAPVCHVHVAVAADGQAPGQVQLVGTVALTPEGNQEAAIGGELLDAVVVGVGDVEVVSGIKGQAGRGIQLALSGAVLAPMGQQSAFPVKYRDAVQVLIAGVQPIPAVQGAGREPDELPGGLSVSSKGAVVFAVGIAHGHPHAPGHVVQGAVGDKHAPVGGNSRVGGVVEPPAFHGGHAQGHAVFEVLDLR